jgi:predicted phosphodiesterase
MRIAALYDIHGNAPALRAVLDDVRAARPALVVIGGDVVAGPQPAEVLDLLLESGLVLRWVMGNADRAVLDPPDDDTPLAAFDRFAASRLRPEQRALVETFEPAVAAGGMLFCHGSPRSDTEKLTRVTPEARFAEVLAGVRQRTVVCGHTHQQFDREAAGHRIVNAGAVGMPYEGDAAAFWALLDDGDVRLRRSAYDVAAAAQQLRATGAPDVDEVMLRESLLEPVDPDEVARFFEPDPEREPEAGA